MRVGTREARAIAARTLRVNGRYHVIPDFSVPSSGEAGGVQVELGEYGDERYEAVA
jgi:hypothetical protein